MSAYTLQNNILRITVKEAGAELTSIRDIRTNTEYLWNAEEAYWKRHAPILFPIVGSLKNKSYTYQGETYSLPQHGFARDKRFSLINHTDDELWFGLESDEDTKKVYPFDFRLELGYRLEGNQITCLWRVINTGRNMLFFSIGGHPAFLCPLRKEEKQSDYYLFFDTEEPIHYQIVDGNGLLTKKPFVDQYILNTEKGYLPIDPHLFDRDALVIEEHQYHRVSLADHNKKLYLTVSFDAPLFGLWSPAGKNAPFVCIEPWYGRCDASEFSGNLKDREYSNSLNPREVFEASYSIHIHE
jgi:galactose mutarotase-like enzyme